jgi:hypothetical protein
MYIASFQNTHFLSSLCRNIFEKCEKNCIVQVLHIYCVMFYCLCVYRLAGRLTIPRLIAYLLLHDGIESFVLLFREKYPKKCSDK